MSKNCRAGVRNAVRILILTFLAAPIAAMACKRETNQKTPSSADKTANETVTVYCSVDEQYARNILQQFERDRGVSLQVTFDTEAGKTTGLVNRIIAEASSKRPRADVFWSSELFNTIRLARQGLLKSYAPATADDIPKRFRDAHNRWTGCAVRARVIAYDSERVSADDVPDAWEELGSTDHAPRTALANPLFGTTCGHVSAMFALWGKERARAFLTDLRAGGALIADGNSAAVRAVIAGRASWAATDTDDVWVAQQQHPSIQMVYPDLGDGGTLLIPCSVALIAGRPDNATARKLADFLVSAEVERQLAESRSRNIPVRESLRQSLNLDWPPETRVEFDAIVDSLDDAMADVREILLR